MCGYLMGLGGSFLVFMARWSQELSTHSLESFNTVNCLQLLFQIISCGLQDFVALNVSTDTNNRISYQTKHILPSNANICYRIYLKRNEINGLGTSDPIVMY